MFIEALIKARGGNITIVKNGVDLFRVRASGHGFASASVTHIKQQIATRGPNAGKVFSKDGLEELLNWSHIKEIWRALRGDAGYSIRTLSGK